MRVEPFHWFVALLEHKKGNLNFWPFSLIFISDLVALKLRKGTSTSTFPLKLKNQLPLPVCQPSRRQNRTGSHLANLFPPCVALWDVKSFPELFTGGWLIAGTGCFSERRSERALILAEREWRSKVQGWARARAHPKSNERERKLSLIFCAQNIAIFKKIRFLKWPPESEKRVLFHA